MKATASSPEGAIRPSTLLNSGTSSSLTITVAYGTVMSVSLSAFGLVSAKEVGPSLSVRMRLTSFIVAVLVASKNMRLATS